MFNTIDNYKQAIADGYKYDLINRMTAQQEEVIRAREYDDGVHYSQLTDRLIQFLNVRRDAVFNANYCPLVLDAKNDRLAVIGFDSEDEVYTDIIWQWWRANRMSQQQQHIHRATLRDGNAYVLVEWNSDAQRPAFTFEPTYVGDGMMVYYDDEHRSKIAFASKQWRVSRGGNAGKLRRINLYFSNRIEKYVSNDSVFGGNWRPYQTDDTYEIRTGYLGQAAISWWTTTGTEAGEPLGVPVVHFKNRSNGEQYGKSELCDVIPLQNALNKSLIDLIAAMDVAGFGLLVGTGTTAWVDAQVGPGAVAAVSQSARDADLKRLQGDNPTGLLDVYKTLVMEIGRVSKTPLSYFQVTGQVAGEGTLKQQEAALIAQVENLQTAFGDGYERMMQIGARLHNAFSTDAPIVPDEFLETIWKPAATRDDKAHAETLMLHKELGVSEDTIQSQLGYTATQIASHKRARLQQAALQIRQQTRGILNDQQREEVTTDDNR